MKSVIVPAYNEERRIELCLIWCLNLFDEVIVVCDGTDRTAEIVKFYSVLDDRVFLVNSPKRLGKGGAFKRGFESAVGDLIFLVDTDCPVPSRFVCMFECCLEKADVVVGSRYLPGSRIVGGFPRVRRLLSDGYRGLCRFVLDCDLSDFQCGFKAFRKEVLESVLPEMVCCGWGFDVELLARVLGLGCVVAEVPVTWRYDGLSKVGLGTPFEMLRDLGKVRHALKI